MKIAVIIVAFNRKKLLVECLETIKKQTYKVADVFLIDNGSTDGTYEYLEEKNVFDDTHIKYTNLGKNTGGAGGFYYGLKIAFKEKYDAYWLMDDDSIPYVDALQELVKSPQFLNPKCGVLNSAIFDINNAYINTQKQYDWTNGNTKEIQLNSISKGEEIAVDISSFVGFFVKHNVVKEVGFPNKDFFIQYDDNDYSLAIREKGYENYLIFDSKIKHKIDSAFESNGILKIAGLWKFYYGNRNKIFVGKHRIKGAVNKIIFIGYQFLKLCKNLLFNLFLDKPFLRNKIWMMSFFHGIFGVLGKKIDPVSYLKKIGKTK